MTLCVIAPEIALTVTCVVAGAAGVVAALDSECRFR
jgi:hypothetical protein